MVLKIDDPRRRSPEVVKEVLAGRSGALPLAAAVTLLADLDVPVGEQEDLLGRVAASATEATARSAAAIALRRLPRAGAREKLAAALPREREPRVAADMALSLAFVGNEQDVETLMNKASELQEGFARDRARFAAAVVAHRLGLREPHLPFPEARLRVGEKTVGIQGRGLDEPEVALALDALDADPVGIESAPELVHALACGPRTLYLALNREVASNLGDLHGRKAVLGVIETYNEALERAAPAMLVLTDPAEEGFAAFVTRLTGEPLYRGTGTAKDNRLDAELWSVDAIGVTAMDLHVTLEGRSLSVDGTSDSTVRKQLQPKPLR